MNLTASDLTTIAALLAAIAPVTAGVVKGLELALSYQRQRHELARARAEQDHKIATEYLDRALKPETPIAMRTMLLRFLATPDDGTRLREWAKYELSKTDAVILPLEKQMTDAMQAVQRAVDEKSLAVAQEQLVLARSKQDLLSPPPPVALSAAAIRSGHFTSWTLPDLKMVDQDLRGAKLGFSKLRGADFSESDLTGADFITSDLREAKFANTVMENVRLWRADCRGACFRNASLQGADLRLMRAERADFTDADMVGAHVGGIVFDDHTVWPKGFDPRRRGAVHAGGADAPVVNGEGTAEHVDAETSSESKEGDRP